MPQTFHSGMHVELLPSMDGPSETMGVSGRDVNRYEEILHVKNRQNNTKSSGLSKRGKKKNRNDGHKSAGCAPECMPQYATVRYDMNTVGAYPYAYQMPADSYAQPREMLPIYYSGQFVPYFGWDVYNQQQVMYQSGHFKHDAETGKSNAEMQPGNCRTGKEGHPVTSPSTLGSLWTSSALPAIEDKNDDAPDLERFLRAATPRFRLSTDTNSLRELKMLDVWKHFERISAYGLRCSTLGGPRGVSSSYFVPFLSSVQLYESISGTEDTEVLSYPDGLEAWPRNMRRCYRWSAKNHVGERLPLYQQVMELCGSNGAAHVLSSSKISDLHPYSWFAVAWYPLYRIPEAPLTARFLTFHSIAPLWEAGMQSIADRKSISALHLDSLAALKISDARKSMCGALSSTTVKGVSSFPGSSASDSTPNGSSHGSQRAEGGNANSDTASVTASGPASPNHNSGDEEEEEKIASCAATTISSSASLSKIELPPVGLCWHTTSGNGSTRHRKLPSENWTDTMVKLNASEQTRLSQGDSLPGSTHACVVNVSSNYVVVKKDYPLSKGGPLSWDIQLEELADGARRLALGVGIEAADSSGNSSFPEDDICPDYQFFVSRTSQ